MSIFIGRQDDGDGLMVLTSLSLLISRRIHKWSTGVRFRPHRLASTPSLRSIHEKLLECEMSVNILCVGEKINTRRLLRISLLISSPASLWASGYIVSSVVSHCDTDVLNCFISCYSDCNEQSLST